MRETKTVQVYPSDDIVNATIEEYGSFGWEVIGNQRCQEYEGQTLNIFDGSSTKHYSTFNKITFSREKFTPWYEPVTQLEREYFSLKDTINSYEAKKPVLRKPKPEGSMGFWLGAFFYVLYIVPGIIYTIVRCCLKSKYKKQYQKQLSKYNRIYSPQIKELENRQYELRSYAVMYLSGRVQYN